MNECLESEVRSYCRSFPDVFSTAIGSIVFNNDGKQYIDFLSGCGSLNYGHNHPDIRDALINYIENQGIAMSLDMATSSKDAFLQAFSQFILKPRGFNYKVQFSGPTGANSIEAAIKLARKVTGRTNVVAFTNGFHGCSLGALALTGSKHHRSSSEALLTNVMHAPYDGYWGADIDTSFHLDKLLSDPSSGFDAPAAIIVETIQGEGGLNVASVDWLTRIAVIARKFGALLIIDDIQAGCGRSGEFFSFESLGIEPDIVCLAKSISGFGLPMSLVLLKTEYDIWEPGEHNGTFRGNNLAFVTATTAIEKFWSTDDFQHIIRSNGAEIEGFLSQLSTDYSEDLSVKGRGMMRGLHFSDPKNSKAVQKKCFSNGLIIELSGPCNEVVKLLPPLNIDDKTLNIGFRIIEKSIHDVLRNASEVKFEAA